MKYVVTWGLASLLASLSVAAAEPVRILTNHLGYESRGPKRAIIQESAEDRIRLCSIRASPGESLVREIVPNAAQAVPGWRDWSRGPGAAGAVTSPAGSSDVPSGDWRFSSLDFSDFQQEGSYFLECRNEGAGQRSTVRSSIFRVQRDILERATLSNVIAYFKAERSSGAIDRADAKIHFSNPRLRPIDAHGGWYDATGDYGIHFSQLDFTSYFNTQQVPLAVYTLGRTYELLEARGDRDFDQLERRLADEAAYGADFLVRMRRPGRSFYESISAPGPKKLPQDRRVAPAMLGFRLKKTQDDRRVDNPNDRYEVSYRSGAGFAIAALAIAARLPLGGDFDKSTYLENAESAFAYLEKNNPALLNDGIENILDDFCALAAATELLRTTHREVYRIAAQARVDRLLHRLVSDGPYHDYWQADDHGRPFFHPSDAGAPVVTLLAYYPLADEKTQVSIKDAVRRSLASELSITREVANPFGLARQYVQSKGKGRRTEFFFPHDTEAAPWWQGENARLASLAAAARFAAVWFADDPAFASQLQRFASDQLNWILGLNPFDACMLHGSGRNNPEYGFFSSWQYTNFPGGIVNGITSGYQDGEGIDFNLSYSQTHEDIDWRWSEQWLPHASWYMLAVAAGQSQPSS